MRNSVKFPCEGVALTRYGIDCVFRGCQCTSGSDLTVCQVLLIREGRPTMVLKAATPTRMITDTVSPLDPILLTPTMVRTERALVLGLSSVTVEEFLDTRWLRILSSPTSLHHPFRL